MFKSIPVYIKLWKNRVEVTELDTGNTVARSAIDGFSSIRNVVSNFNNANATITSALKELGVKHSIFSPSLKAVIQQLEGTEGGLSDIEKRALRDLAEMAGAKWVTILDHSNELTIAEALMMLDSK